MSKFTKSELATTEAINAIATPLAYAMLIGGTAFLAWCVYQLLGAALIAARWL